jgi:hypothetical protein
LQVTDRKAVFITGIGPGLIRESLSRDRRVYGVSRRGCPLELADAFAKLPACPSGGLLDIRAMQ